MNELSVNVKNLTKKFGDFTAVNNVSFQIPRGSIFGFLGPNGAGKSTTIRMLLGIIIPTEGEGNVLGLDIKTQSEQIRARVGYMSQKFSLYEDLTVLENLDFFSGLFNISGARKKERIGELLDIAKLRGYENKMALDLPGGIKQRLAFGVSLLHDPEIVFLDEPTGGVDPALRRYFWDVIVKLSEQGKTIMVTTHYMDEVERCNDICFIYGGRLIAQGSPTRLKTDYFKGELFECTTKQRLKTIDELKKIKGVVYPFPSGEKVRFIIEGGSLNPEKAQAMLRERGMSGCSVKKTQPTLEDVFVSLVANLERKEKDAA